MDKQAQKLLLFGGLGLGAFWLLSKGGQGAAGMPPGTVAAPGPTGNPLNYGGWQEVIGPNGYYWRCAVPPCVAANPS
jgi:hypothetical protein